MSNLSSFIFIFIFFQFFESKIASPGLKRKFNEELLKRTMELEEKWKNLLHPLANVLYASFYIQENTRILKEAVKKLESNDQGTVLLFIMPEYLQGPIELPAHILDYTKRLFGGNKLPMVGETGRLDGNAVRKELEKLGNLYLDSGLKYIFLDKGENGEEMVVDFKREYMQDKRYKFNEKAKIWHQMENGILVQNIFPTISDAKLFIEMIVKTILLTCKMDVNMEMEMNGENAENFDLPKCILGKNFKQKNLMENFNKILDATEDWKKTKIESRKKFESSFERIAEDAQGIGHEMRRKYFKDKKFFQQTQPAYAISEQTKLFIKGKSDAEWVHLNGEVLGDLVIGIRILQCVLAIQHEILMLLLKSEIAEAIISMDRLIDLNSHKNTLEYSQKLAYSLEKALAQTILGTISIELEHSEKNAELNGEWEKMQNKIHEIKRSGIGNENVELKELIGQKENFEKEIEERKQRKGAMVGRIKGSEGFKKREKKYLEEYSHIFVGSLPELIVPKIVRSQMDIDRLAEENVSNKLSLNLVQKVKIIDMLIKMLNNPQGIKEETLMLAIDHQHMQTAQEALKRGESEEDRKQREKAEIEEHKFFAHFDNLAKISILDIGIWVRLPPTKSMNYRISVHSIIGSKIAIFVEEVIRMWRENNEEWMNALRQPIPDLALKKQKMHADLANLVKINERMGYKPNQLSLIFEPKKQLETLVQIFITENEEEAEYDPMDVVKLEEVKEEPEEIKNEPE